MTDDGRADELRLADVDHADDAARRLRELQADALKKLEALAAEGDGLAATALGMFRSRLHGGGGGCDDTAAPKFVGSQLGAESVRPWPSSPLSS